MDRTSIAGLLHLASVACGTASGGEAMFRLAHGFDGTLSARLTPGGRLLAAAGTHGLNGATLFRYRLDGTLDPTLGSWGRASTVPGEFQKVTVLDYTREVAAISDAEEPVGTPVGCILRLE
jgi:hypothetical protein